PADRPIHDRGYHTARRERPTAGRGLPRRDATRRGAEGGQDPDTGDRQDRLQGAAGNNRIIVFLKHPVTTVWLPLPASGRRPGGEVRASCDRTRSPLPPAPLSEAERGEKDTRYGFFGPSTGRSLLNPNSSRIFRFLALYASTSHFNSSACSSARSTSLLSLF